MSAADLSRVAGIARASLPEAWTREGFAAELAKPTCIALAHADGFAIGSIVEDELEVLTLAVAPSARRGGIGRALVGALLDAARARGATRAFLEVRVTNAAAIALYESHGFAITGTRARYYQDGEDATLMEAVLAT